ncbi:MAG: hypothetical protein ACR2QV_13510 [Gammaproteobacteria bacterium]
MKLTSTIIFAALGALFFGPVASASGSYFDTARVIASEPVYETRREPSQEQQCGYRPSDAPARVDNRVLGDVRLVDKTANLSDAMMTDIAIRKPGEPVYRCRMVERMNERKQLIGYDVRYEYGGRIYARRVTEQPGDTLRIRVRLSAGSADWSWARAANEAQ